MTTIINGSSPSITFSDGSAQTSATQPFQNRIINGAMVIDQRNDGASVTVNSTTVQFPVDRFQGRGESADGVFTVQQSSTAPAGFVNSLVATVTTADSSIGAGQLYFLRQNIEGFNVADFNLGSANAQTFTLSFWVRSSVTGTFGGSVANQNFNRSYPFTYTISVANTFEYKTITIAGDTSGTWATNNTSGLRVIWSLGAGSTYITTANAWATGEYYGATGQTNLIATNGATFFITGVQLEKGNTATSFDYRPYGTELALCQRYCWKYGGNAASYLNGPGLYADGNTIIFGPIPNPVSARAAVSLTVVGSPRVAVNGANSSGWTPTLSGPGDPLNSWIDMAKLGHGLTAGVTTNIYLSATSDYFLFTAEL